jgi:hypothetical protein
MQVPARIAAITLASTPFPVLHAAWLLPDILGQRDPSTWESAMPKKKRFVEPKLQEEGSLAPRTQGGLVSGGADADKFFDDPN